MWQELFTTFILLGLGHPPEDDPGRPNNINPLECFGPSVGYLASSWDCLNKDSYYSEVNLIYIFYVFNIISITAVISMIRRKLTSFTSYNRTMPVASSPLQ